MVDSLFEATWLRRPNYYNRWALKEHERDALALAAFSVDTDREAASRRIDAPLTYFDE
jgi:hypothetical protein